MAQSMRPRDRNGFEVAVVCALPIEAEAVQDVFDQLFSKNKNGEEYGQHPGDSNAYTTGRIGEHSVVLTHMKDMGKVNAASAAAKVLISFPGIKLALVVGVCGAVPFPPALQGEEIILGDVIISDEVVEYDRGKRTTNGFIRKQGNYGTNAGVKSFLAKLQTSQQRASLEGKMKQYLTSLAKREKWHYPASRDTLFEASERHMHRSSQAVCTDCEATQHCQEAMLTSCSDLGCDVMKQINRLRLGGQSNPWPKLHLGAIASADMVMMSAEERDAIAAEEMIIGFEMEGAGIRDSIPSCVVIKGASDYADSHKRKSWQSYAAATAAAATHALLELWPSSRQLRTAHWSIPFERNRNFVGRASHLSELQDEFNRPSSKISIVGLGGVGKSALALELAYRVKTTTPCSVFWVHSANPQTFEQAFLSIAQQLELDISAVDAKTRVKQYLSSTDEPWLMIFDNADDIGTWFGRENSIPLIDYVPTSEHGCAVLTTRNRQLAVKFAKRVLEVDTMDNATATQFLRSLLIRKSTAEEPIIDEMLEHLGYLPLAISQAAAFINEKDVRLSDYMSLLEGSEDDLIRILATNFEDEGKYVGERNSIATTWLVSFEDIRRRSPSAAQLLSFLAFVEPREIPQSILPTQSGSAQDRIEALSTLKAYSFVSERLDGSLEMHRLVQVAMRNWLKQKKTYGKYMERALKQIDAVFPRSSAELSRAGNILSPHAKSIITHHQCCRLSLLRVRKRNPILNYHHRLQRSYSIAMGCHMTEMSLLFKYLDFLSLRRRWGELDKMIPPILETFQNQLRRYGSESFRLMNLLAYSKMEQGKIDELSTIISGDSRRGTLKIQQNKIPGGKNSFWLVLYYLTADVETGQLKQAEDLCLELLSIVERRLGKESAVAIAYMHLMSRIYLFRGSWDEAERFGLQAMDCSIKALGWKSAHTFATADLLVKILVHQRRLTDAEVLAVKNMEEREAVFGPDDFSTLQGMMTLGNVYLSMRRLEEAEQMSSQAVQGCIRVVGKEHLDTATAMHLLVDVYHAQGKIPERDILWAEVCAIRSKSQLPSSRV